MGIDLEEIDDTPEKPDFRRANGAPMIVDKEGKNQRYSRPSSFGKVLDDESALTNWRIDRAIVGVAKDRAIQARVIAAKEDDRSAWTSLREVSISAGRGAEKADIGTALHAMSERWEKETDFDPGPPYRAKLEAYTAEMERLGLVSEMFEFPMVSTDYRTAGTCDRLYQLTRPLVLPSGEIMEAGTFVIGDLKTGAKLEYSIPGYAIQLALYACGELYDVVADQFLPTPPINQYWGLIVWMPSGDEDTCEFLWVSLDVGNYGAYLVHETKDWRKKWRSGEWAASPVETWEPTTEPEVEIEAVTPTLSPEALVEFIKHRIAAIRQHDDARQYLMMEWPAGIPTPKHGLRKPDDITQVLNCLDKVEAKFALGWPEGDPRTRPGTHQSAGPNRNDQLQEITTP